MLAHGFARVVCRRCSRETLVAFSPVRQWVLTLPWRLRFLLATDPDLLRAVRRRFLAAVFASYRSRAARLGLPGARTGAVNVVQRFGSALNLK